MAKYCSISIWPQDGSISFPHKPTVIKSTNTSQKCNSMKQKVNIVQIQKVGGIKYPGVTLRISTARSEKDSAYPTRVEMQMNLIDDEVFPSRAENCCRKYIALLLPLLAMANVPWRSSDWVYMENWFSSVDIIRYR